MANLRAGVPVQIHLETMMKNAEDSNSFVFDLTGQLVQIGETIYIRYVELGEEGEVPVTVKIMPNGDVRLTRAAGSRLQLLFSPGKRVTAHYKTPYGLMDIDTVTPNMDINISDGPLRGNLAIDYLLYAGEELLGKYNIRLQFTI
ncbi:DUF1934 domain-containing protein [Lentilactobacillus senioris]|uniref:DUF1934 domain-containing protein n=1 Tax=Lentilactobacillus senioris TaxID=931534 RepID=UPI002283232F|nr:DUF1934 domain-containing protein [Lentilactobacillus senioris]MCY9807556.1 DUF1934 domain-containing protein [Lentilactobacillus senioris]